MTFCLLIFISCCIPLFIGSTEPDFILSLLQAKKISAVILSGTDHGDVTGYFLHYSLDGQQWTSKPRVAVRKTHVYFFNQLQGLRCLVVVLKISG